MEARQPHKRAWAVCGASRSGAVRYLSPGAVRRSYGRVARRGRRRLNLPKVAKRGRRGQASHTKRPRARLGALPLGWRMAEPDRVPGAGSYPLSNPPSSAVRPGGVLNLTGRQPGNRHRGRRGNSARKPCKKMTAHRSGPGAGVVVLGTLPDGNRSVASLSRGHFQMVFKPDRFKTPGGAGRRFLWR